jgi:uncharacterized protein (DUF1778 family)
MSEGPLMRRGRATISVHVPLSKLEFIDEAIRKTGESTSSFFVNAAIERAKVELGRNDNGDTP